MASYEELLEAEALRQAIENPKPNRDLLDEAGAGVIGGLYSLKEAGYGLAGLAGEAIDSEGLKEWAMEGAEATKRQAAPYQQSVELENVDSVGKFMQWAAYGLGSVLPTMAASWGSGAVVGLGARALAKKGLEKAAAKWIAENGEKIAADSALAQLGGKELLGSVAERIAAEKIGQSAIAKEAAKRGISASEVSATNLVKNQALKHGGVTGAFAASDLMSTGSISGEMLDATGEVNVPAALIGGALVGALDVIPEFVLAKKMGIFGATQGIAGNLLTRVAKTGASQAGLEGLTEGAQTVIEKIALKYADPSLDLTSKKVILEIIESALIGALSGLLFGGLGGLATKRKRTNNTPTDLIQASTENNIPTAPTPEARETAKEGSDRSPIWNRIVEVEEVARQFDWWTHSSPEERKIYATAHAFQSAPSLTPEMQKKLWLERTGLEGKYSPEEIDAVWENAKYVDDVKPIIAALNDPSVQDKLKRVLASAKGTVTKTLNSLNAQNLDEAQAMAVPESQAEPALTEGISNQVLPAPSEGLPVVAPAPNQTLLTEPAVQSENESVNAPALPQQALPVVDRASSESVFTSQPDPTFYEAPALGAEPISAPVEEVPYTAAEEKAATPPVSASLVSAPISAPVQGEPKKATRKKLKAASGAKQSAPETATVPLETTTVPAKTLKKAGIKKPLQEQSSVSVPEKKVKAPKPILPDRTEQDYLTLIQEEAVKALEHVKKADRDKIDARAKEIYKALREKDKSSATLIHAKWGATVEHFAEKGVGLKASDTLKSAVGKIKEGTVNVIDGLIGKGLKSGPLPFGDINWEKLKYGVTKILEGFVEAGVGIKQAAIHTLKMVMDKYSGEDYGRLHQEVSDFLWNEITKRRREYELEPNKSKRPEHLRPYTEEKVYKSDLEYVIAPPATFGNERVEKPTPKPEAPKPTFGELKKQMESLRKVKEPMYAKRVLKEEPDAATLQEVEKRSKEINESIERTKNPEAGIPPTTVRAVMEEDSYGDSDITLKDGDGNVIGIIKGPSRKRKEAEMKHPVVEDGHVVLKVKETKREVLPENSLGEFPERRIGIDWALAKKANAMFQYVEATGTLPSQEEQNAYVSFVTEALDPLKSKFGIPATIKAQILYEYGIKDGKLNEDIIKANIKKLTNNDRPIRYEEGDTLVYNKAGDLLGIVVSGIEQNPLVIQEIGEDGKPVFDAKGNPVMVTISGPAYVEMNPHITDRKVATKKVASKTEGFERTRKKEESADDVLAKILGSPIEDGYVNIKEMPDEELNSILESILSDDTPEEVSYQKFTETLRGVSSEEFKANPDKVIQEQAKIIKDRLFSNTKLSKGNEELADMVVRSYVEDYLELYHSNYQTKTTGMNNTTFRLLSEAMLLRKSERVIKNQSVILGNRHMLPHENERFLYSRLEELIRTDPDFPDEANGNKWASLIKRKSATLQGYNVQDELYSTGLLDALLNSMSESRTVTWTKADVISHLRTSQPLVWKVSQSRTGIASAPQIKEMDAVFDSLTEYSKVIPFVLDYAQGRVSSNEYRSVLRTVQPHLSEENYASLTSMLEASKKAGYAVIPPYYERSLPKGSEKELTPSYMEETYSLVSANEALGPNQYDAPHWEQTGIKNILASVSSVRVGDVKLILELQSDLRRKVAESEEAAKAAKEEGSVNVEEDSQTMALRGSWYGRILKHQLYDAALSGAKGIALPKSLSQISSIENWDNKNIHTGVVRQYLETYPKVLDSLAKRFGGKVTELSLNKPWEGGWDSVTYLEITPEMRKRIIREGMAAYTYQENPQFTVRYFGTISTDALASDIVIDKNVAKVEQSLRDVLNLGYSPSIIRKALGDALGRVIDESSTDKLSRIMDNWEAMEPVVNKILGPSDYQMIPVTKNLLNTIENVFNTVIGEGNWQFRISSALEANPASIMQNHNVTLVEAQSAQVAGEIYLEHVGKWAAFIDLATNPHLTEADLLNTAWHEAAHSIIKVMRYADPEAYSILTGRVEKLGKISHIRENAHIEERAAQYLADVATGRIKLLSQTDRTIMERVKDLLQKVADAIRSLFNAGKIHHRNFNDIVNDALTGAYTLSRVTDPKADLMGSYNTIFQKASNEAQRAMMRSEKNRSQNHVYDFMNRNFRLPRFFAEFNPNFKRIYAEAEKSMQVKETLMHSLVNTTVKWKRDPVWGVEFTFKKHYSDMFKNDREFSDAVIKALRAYAGNDTHEYTKAIDALRERGFLERATPIMKNVQKIYAEAVAKSSRHELFELGRNEQKNVLNVAWLSDEHNIMLSAEELASGVVDRKEKKVGPFTTKEVKFTFKGLSPKEIDAYYAINRSTRQALREYLTALKDLSYIMYEQDPDRLGAIKEWIALRESNEWKYRSDAAFLKEVRSVMREEGADKEYIDSMVIDLQTIIDFRKNHKGLEQALATVKYYMPRVRPKGRFIIEAFDKNLPEGQQMIAKYFTHPGLKPIEKKEAQEIYDKLRAKYPSASISIRAADQKAEQWAGMLNWSVMEKFLKSAQDAVESRATSLERAALVRDFFAEITKEVRDELNAMGSAKKHKIERNERYIEGFEKEDGHVILFDYFNSMANEVARLPFSMRANRVLGEINPKTNAVEFDNSVKFINHILAPENYYDRVSANARAWAFLYYLGLNLKSSAIQLTQTFITGWPLLSFRMKENGWSGNAFAIQSKALKDATNYVLFKKGIIKNHGLSKEEFLALESASVAGTTEAQFINQQRNVIAESSSDKKKIVQSKISQFMNVAAIPFAFAEEVNRNGAFLAMFRASGADRSNSAKYRSELAKAFVDQTHYVFGKLNVPFMMMGASPANAVLRTGYTFRNFQHNFFESMYLIWKTAERKDMKLDAVKTYGKVLASMVFFAGAMGIPFADDLLDFLERKTGVAFRTKIKHSLSMNSKFLERFIEGGMPNALAGANVSGSLYLGGPDGLDGAVFGVYGSFVDRVRYAMEAMGANNYLRAFEELSPAFVQSPLKAYRLSKEGQRSPSGKERLDEGGLPAKIGTYDAILQALSFRPGSVASTQSERRTAQNVEAYFRGIRSQIQGQFRIERTITSDLQKAITKYNLEASKYGKAIPKITLAGLREGLKPTHSHKLMQEIAKR